MQCHQGRAGQALLVQPAAGKQAFLMALDKAGVEMGGLKVRVVRQPLQEASTQPASQERHADPKRSKKISTPTTSVARTRGTSKRAAGTGKRGKQS